MSKTEVYSWRLKPQLKDSLAHAARERGRSVAGLLEEIVESWLMHEMPDGGGEEVQRRLREQALAACGTLRGGDPELATQARDRLRRKLRREHAAGRAG